jgi:hypothetical protein
MQSIRDYTMVVRPDDNGTFVAQTELQNVFEVIAEEHREEGKAMPPDIEEFVRRKKIEKLFDRAAAGEFKFDNVNFDRLRHDRTS